MRPQNFKIRLGKCIVALGLVVLMLFSSFYSAAAAQFATEDNGKILIFVSNYSGWAPAGSLSYSKNLEKKQFYLETILNSPDESMQIKLVKDGGGTAHIDAVLLGDIAPNAVEVKKSDLSKLQKEDYDLLELDDEGMILTFPASEKNSVLSITARIEGEIISQIPVQFPLENTNKTIAKDSCFYDYTLNSSLGAICVDGNIGEVNGLQPFMEEFVVPGSGHPSGKVYAWVMNDDQNLYVAFDVTPDNTMDGNKDYTKVYVKIGDQIKEFKISMKENKWGLPGFIYTDRAAYQHKVYEFSIPIAKLGADINSNEGIQLAFATYGTMSAPDLSYDFSNRISDTEAEVSFISGSPGQYYYEVVQVGENPSNLISGEGLALEDGRNALQLNNLTAGAQEVCIIAEYGTEYFSNTLRIPIREWISEPPILSGDGDIWVVEGHYNIWDSQDLNGDHIISEDDFYERYPDRDMFMDTAFPVERLPITSNGQPINRNLYVLDGTELYFGNLDLGTGGVYNFDAYNYDMAASEMNTLNDFYRYQTIIIRNGTLKASEIYSARYISIGSDDDEEDFNDHISIKLSNDMVAKYLIEIFGGSVTVDGMIKTLDEDEPQTIFIFGGTINAGVISSATSLYIGEETDYFGTNSEIRIHVGTITTCENIYINGGVVYAESIGSLDDFFIADEATLFDAVNHGLVRPENGAFNLYRAKLTGLVPNRSAEIYIPNENYRGGIKTFTTGADEDGNIYVWLLPGNITSAEAIYVNSDTLSAKDTNISKDGDVVIFSGDIDPTDPPDPPDPSHHSHSSTVYHTLSAAASPGGTIAPNGNVRVVRGSDKTFAIVPDEGYLIDDVLIDGRSVGAVSEYTFENVTRSYAIEAKFKWNNPFTDVSEDKWYYDAIVFGMQRGLFKGTSNTSFEPDFPINRAMFVTLLGRLTKIDESFFIGSSFDDTPTGQWYCAYVEWGAKNGVVLGYGNGNFGPNDPISREQICAIIVRYCEYAKIELPQLAAATFSDDSKISNWAKYYVTKARLAGLIQGVGNNIFDPLGNASRAQVAEILMRLILTIMES